MHFNDAIRVRDLASASKPLGKRFAGRFITDALLVEMKDEFITFVMSELSECPPFQVLHRDIDVERMKGEAVSGVGIKVKCDASYSRVRVNIPGRGDDTRQFVVIVDLDTEKVRPGTAGIRKEIVAGITEWCCTTDDGSLFYANNENITIERIFDTCTDSLVPHSLVQCLRHHGIGEMWVMKSEREATYDWFVDDVIVKRSMKGVN